MYFGVIRRFPTPDFRLQLGIWLKRAVMHNHVNCNGSDSRGPYSFDTAEASLKAVTRQNQPLRARSTK